MRNVGSRPGEEKGALARATQRVALRQSALRRLRGSPAPRQPGRQEGVGTGEPTPRRVKFKPDLTAGRPPCQDCPPLHSSQ